MDDDWITSPAARRIFIHWTDPRPAWLWSRDGTSLLWRNRAAAFFGAKLKKSGLRLAAEPVPIKGQIARLIRLGSPGRSSLARLQFLAGGRPASTTATVTPLEDAGRSLILLAVGVDPIAAELVDQPVPVEAGIEHAVLPAGAAYLLVDADGRVIGGPRGLAERFAAVPPDATTLEVEGEPRPLARYKASPQGDQLILLEARPGGKREIEDIRAEEGVAAFETVSAVGRAEDEPTLPMALPELEENAAPEQETAPEPPPVFESMPLSSLFDRLADSEALYRGLPKPVAEEPPEGVAPADDEPELAIGAPAEVETESAGVSHEDAVAQPAPTGETDVIAAVIEFADDLEADAPAQVSYRVTGRGFIEDATPAPGEAPEPISMDGESRRNFSEISRILSDGVVDDTSQVEEPPEIDPAIEPMPPPAALPSQDRSLVSIGAETFILNRLPLGILVFRDQQVLFANRALTDLVGHPTIDSLREAGLSAIFPDDDLAAAGPVSHLVRRDGARMPVTARLQSVTWQGRPALMLSAARTEAQGSTETGVRNFAAALAALRGEGFITLDPAGVLQTVSARAAELLGKSATEGQPLATLVLGDAGNGLSDFLAKPARFAETERPMLLLNGPDGTTIALFAEGMAGIVKGYFGLVGRTAPDTEDVYSEAARGDDDPAMLARISRGVRRPLNTIIGFADLIRSAAFGTIENHRYLEYARDIRTAGQEIAVLIDELDDYAHLNAGTFPVRPAELDLAALLESCVVRVRGQASAARVLVRSAISEGLPNIRADRASLGQAVLNLLASAIDQTPANGSVILSAQRDESGGIVVNVRDSGEAAADPGERFVVFRDGVGKDGEALAPVRSSVGLALTRSLVAVNACVLTVTPAGAVGTIFSVSIPPDLVGPAAA